MALNFGVLLLCLLLLAPIVSAQNSGIEGQPIVVVVVSGLRVIKESVVLEQMNSKRGQPYHAAVADHDVVLLDRLGVFGSVQIRPVIEAGGVRLEVTLVETLQKLPALAIAVTDENGASAGPSVKLLSVAGRPRDVSATARFGGETLVEFRETSAPMVHDRFWHSVQLSIRDRFNKLNQFNENSAELDMRVGLRASESRKNGAIFQVYHLESDEDGITLDPDNTDTTLSVGGITELDTRDSWREPSRGWWNSVDYLWRSSSTSYGTLDVDVRRYQPLAARQTLVATSLLTLQSGTVGRDVPVYARFAIGGANTVRGWNFDSRNGKNQFVNSLEYRFTALPTRTFRVLGFNLYAGVALAAFADAGTAWDESAGFSDNTIGGGGIGLRLFVPFVNMIRLDLAFGDGQAHGLLGVNEKALAARNRVR